MATTEDFTVIPTTNFHDYYDSTFDITTEDYYEYYNNNGSDEVCERTNIIKYGGVFTAVFFSIVVILSVFGNILVIVILATFENLKSLTNAFILNLAISDLFFTAGLPFWAHYHIFGWTLGESACKIVNFVFYVGFYSSGILLILMTIHRYVAVMNPLSDIVSSKGFSSVLVSLVIWTVAALVASPAFIFTKVLEENHCAYMKSYWTLWGIYQQNVLFIVSSVVFIFCYSQIICRLMRPSAQRRRSKTLKLIFALMVVFFLGWAPYNIVIFLNSLYFWPKPDASSEDMKRSCEILIQLDYAFYISRLLAFSHCCLNPVFYVFMGIKFKNHLKRILKRWDKDNRSSINNRLSRPTITSQTSGEELSM